jgi:hypothetical protein
MRLRGMAKLTTKMLDELPPDNVPPRREQIP